MDVTVIIVNWNTCKILRNCLASLYANTKEVEFEVMVVDNASDDGSAEMVKNEFSEVVLIQNSENMGYAAANNQGITIAKGRYILLLNSDMLLLDNVIDKVVKFAVNHNKVAVVGCRILNPDKSLQSSCFMFPSILNLFLLTTYLFHLFPNSKFFGRERLSWWDCRESREVDVVTGCFMLVKHEAIEQVRMMDEDFFMYAEETDWCYRFKRAGWKIMFTPAGEIIHFGGESSKKKHNEMLLQSFGSILLFFKKHKSTLSYYVACLIVALFFALRVPYWLGATVFSKRARYLCWRTAKTYAVGACKALSGWQKLCYYKSRFPSEYEEK